MLVVLASTPARPAVMWQPANIAGTLAASGGATRCVRLVQLAWSVSIGAHLVAVVMSFGTIVQPG